MLRISSKLFLFIALSMLVEYSLATPETMLVLVNNERKKNGVNPLIVDQRLVNAAQGQSDYQASINTMTHDNPKGDMGTRINDAGFDFSTAGENAAFNYPDEASVMEGWMNSPGHRANILNSDFTRFGMGVNNLYWTQDFGRLMNEPSGGSSSDNTPPPSDGSSSDNTPPPSNGSSSDNTPSPSGGSSSDNTPPPSGGSSSDNTPPPPSGGSSKPKPKKPKTRKPKKHRTRHSH